MINKLYNLQKKSYTLGNGRKIILWCGSVDTTTGFGHIVYQGWDDSINFEKSNRVAKINYYNRTWEAYDYQTALYKAIKKLLKDDYISQSEYDEMYQKLKLN